ncbi:MAG: hypothetical protein P4L26_08900 [Terracidiphilus sp.]|nr:hypothetical protein [Terracidiphilus sp.]
MHLNFHFTAVETLWTITFAAELVLLVVLLGRDRIKRFPWFSLAIALMALRLLSIKLLSGRMPTYTLSAIFIAMADVSAIVGLLVVVEIARRAFHGMQRSKWAVSTLPVLTTAIAIPALFVPWPRWQQTTWDSPICLLGWLILMWSLMRKDLLSQNRWARVVWVFAVAGATSGALAPMIAGGGPQTLWGPWPTRQTFSADTPIAVMRLMQMGAQKFDLLVDLLTVELGLLVVLLGRRTGAGWRSHTQRIVIGLSTASLAQLVVEGLWQYIAHTVPPPHTQAEYEHILGLRDKLFNANGALFCAVLIWWIACLWIDQPGAAEPEPTTPQPEYLLPEDETHADHEADAKAEAESGEGTQGKP